MAKKEQHKEMGRPTVMTDETIRKLEIAFAKGYTDAEACLFASIKSLSTLYEYCQKHPDFSDKKELLKKTPSLKAKENIADAIEDGNIDVSKWHLERRNKEEYSLKVEQELSGNLDTTINIIPASKEE